MDLQDHLNCTAECVPAWCFVLMKRHLHLQKMFISALLLMLCISFFLWTLPLALLPPGRLFCHETLNVCVGWWNRIILVHYDNASDWLILKRGGIYVINSLPIQNEPNDLTLQNRRTLSRIICRRDIWDYLLNPFSRWTNANKKVLTLKVDVILITIHCKSYYSEESVQ